jgi:hypothetical protein
MDAKLGRDVRFLKLYALTTTLVGAAAITVAFASQGGKQRFDEIDVGRINIVESDGKLRMVISNRERQHPGQCDGKLIPRPDGRSPGMIFFNHRGDECGGLVFDENGGKGHFVSFTMDKSRQDQTIGIRHLEGDDGQYFAGLTIWDRPDSSLADLVEEMQEIEGLPEKERKAALAEMKERGEFGVERLTVGKRRDEASEITLSDARGRTRIRIAVDPSGDPRIELLDEAGKAMCALPGERPGGTK